MPIQILPPDVAAKIAAGEVVERPANVAKELLENSLDAGATELRVEIRDGGQRLLRVIDNGYGMLADEAQLALERHATSKLQTADDLNQISTFGFRGEALYSIAAVSHLTVTTRHRDEPYGTQLRVEGGSLIASQRAGTPVGTIIGVEHLFFNVPARKKFLRKAVTEAGQIHAVVQHYALAYPERRFSFVNDGRLVFQSTGSGDLFDVLVKVYGLENAKQLTQVGNVALSFQLDGLQQGTAQPSSQAQFEDALDLDVDFMLHEAAVPPNLSRLTDESHQSLPPIQVFGYASVPTLTRANRTSINLFINRRYVEDRSLTHAIVQAYHTLVPGGRYPMATVFVTIDPSQVDVNVHPQKVQVRFVDERAVYSAVQRAVRRAIIETAPVPDLPLPTSDGYAAASAGNRMEPATQWNQSNWDNRGWAARRQQILNAGQRSFDLQTPPPMSGNLSPMVDTPPPIGAAVHTDQPSISSVPDDLATAPAQNDPEGLPVEELSVGRDVVVAEQTPKLPPLRVVGQVGAMYIVAEGPEGVFLIDQHAAHERILYEKYLAQRYGTVAGAVPQQHLLEPLTLHVGHELTGLLAQFLPQLAALGFEVEPFGGDTYLVRAIPSLLSGQDPLRTLEEIVNSLAGRRNLVGEELEARMVKMICKRASIKAGQLLSPLEMQELIHQLEACRSPRTCPHGRPTMIQLSAGELEKAFGRI
ncbi:MAG: DNA mismatch repair endonuclease MutL [Caldilineaceae bacterium]